jgi:hypothetical protein
VHLQGIEEVVTDKGYHSGAVLIAMKSAEVRTYIPEKKQKGQRHWQGKPAQQQAVYENLIVDLSGLGRAVGVRSTRIKC